MTIERDQDGFLSIGTLSEKTGISVDKLRIWERRYGYPKPVRLPSGHRRYPESEARRLRKAAIALNQGFPARIVAPASIQKLNEILGLTTKDEKRNPDWDLDNMKTFRNEKLAQWVEAIVSFDEDRLLKEFNTAWEELDPLTFILDLAVPLLWRIGEYWSEGKLTISHEHYFSELLGDFLATRWREQNNTNAKTSFVLASLPGDQHRLGLQMVANIIALAGVRVINLGPQTPAREIIRAAERFNPDAISISISGIMDERLVLQSLDEIRLYVPDQIEIYIGGKGSPSPPVGITRIYDLRDFYNRISEQAK